MRDRFCPKFHTSQCSGLKVAIIFFNSWKNCSCGLWRVNKQRFWYVILQPEDSTFAGCSISTQPAKVESAGCIKPEINGFLGILTLRFLSSKPEVRTVLLLLYNMVIFTMTMNVLAFYYFIAAGGELEFTSTTLSNFVARHSLVSRKVGISRQNC